MEIAFPAWTLILEEYGLPLTSRFSGIHNFTSRDRMARYTAFSGLSFSPIFVAVGNGEGHVRLDPSRLAGYSIDYPTEFPFNYNLCKSLDGTNPNLIIVTLNII